MDEIFEEQSWLKRNWRWALPASGCLVITVFLGIFVVSLIFGVKTLFKESEPYQTAVQKAQESAWVVSKLGEPIEVVGTPNGNLNYSNNESSAELSIPVQGPKDKANIMVWGKKSEGQWTYSVLKITIQETGQVYDLLTGRVLTGKED